MDDYFRAGLRRAILDARRFSLIATEVEMETWIEPRYLHQALRELRLEHFGPERDAAGKYLPGGKDRTGRAAHEAGPSP